MSDQRDLTVFHKASCRDQVTVEGRSMFGLIILLQYKSFSISQTRGWSVSLEDGAALLLRQGGVGKQPQTGIWGFETLWFLSLSCSSPYIHPYVAHTTLSLGFFSKWTFFHPLLWNSGISSPTSSGDVVQNQLLVLQDKTRLPSSHGKTADGVTLFRLHVCFCCLHADFQTGLRCGGFSFFVPVLEIQNTRSRHILPCSVDPWSLRQKPSQESNDGNKRNILWFVFEQLNFILRCLTDSSIEPLNNNLHPTFSLNVFSCDILYILLLSDKQPVRLYLSSHTCLCIYRLDFLPEVPVGVVDCDWAGSPSHFFPALGFTSTNLVRNKRFLLRASNVTLLLFPVCVFVGVWRGFVVLEENYFMWSVKSAASSQEQKPWWYREMSRSLFVVVSLCLLWHVCSSDYSVASIMWHETWGTKVWTMLIGF